MTPSKEPVAVDAGLEPAHDRFKICCLNHLTNPHQGWWHSGVHGYATKASEDRASIM